MIEPQISNVDSSQIKGAKVFDLAERTSKFGIRVIAFAGKIPQNAINNPLIHQFVRSGTSVGANYMEADGAESKKDFVHKIGICKKEAKESMHWLHMIGTANPSLLEESRKLWKEVHELVLIFSKIIISANKKNS